MNNTDSWSIRCNSAQNMPGFPNSKPMPKEESRRLIQTDKSVMVLILGLSASALTVGCNDVAEESKDSETQSAGADNNVDADTDTDSDSVTDPKMLACFDRYSGCTECGGACEDGYNWEVTYPAGAWEQGTDSSSYSPSAELEAASVTYYSCSICDSCGKELKIRPLDENGTPGDWKDVTYQEFCQYLFDYNKTCNDCLETWGGGFSK